MSLSERIRAGSEAAPWVVEEVVRLERELDTVKNNAVALVGGLFCEKHTAEVRAESFAQFHAKEVARGCTRCLEAEVNRLTAALTPEV